LLYNRYIPETSQNTFINFISNSLVLSGIHTSHIQIRRELNKDADKIDPWIGGHLSACNKAWTWVLDKKMIQCQNLLQLFMGINERIIEPVCRSDASDTRYKKSELNKLRDSDPGGGESSHVPHEDVPEYLNSILVELEKCDSENDQHIMPKRVRFSAATKLAKIAWKTQFQIGYICPFYQGNWVSSRLIMNSLRCHWSLPWLILSVEDDDKQDKGRAYFDEQNLWFRLFNQEGVLTDKFIN